MASPSSPSALVSASQPIPLSLQDWFHSSSAASPQVLLMDGGVSTHLEDIIAPKTFSHRSLWSSSLLLTEEGRASIVKGHQDWLDSGCNVLTTVTYQCHYGLVRIETTTKVAIDESISGEKADVSAATTAAATETASDRNEEGNDKDMERNPMTATPTKDKMREMMIDGVFLAKEAINKSSTKDVNNNDSPQRLASSSSSSLTLRPFVVASTGPYGAAMADGSEYTGNYPPHVTREALVDFHTRKARTLLMEGKPDGLAVETIPSLQEIGVVCEVLRDLQQQQEQESKSEVSPIACWISLACRNGNELNDGHTVEEALRIIQSYDPTGRWITAVGINCCDSACIASLVTTLTKVDATSGRRGIVVYPNSGEHWNAANEDWDEGSGATDSTIADRLMEAVRIIQDACKAECTGTNEAEAGTNEGKQNRVPRIIIGGCCRTNPATIAMLRKRIDDARDF
uniref:Hcy-binding domain-containing protein n=2 Tax=Pseudo-nitzschia australis TaxID=44445 RepID=A0A7S4ANN4_9STRA|eukprot:CAMPEP_0168298050 /NCGR_PEP_ID=MMETSP0142_2-20121227/21331_1 /TAXON_ID=44445 /ORGANISM="Pseudo-nitzschia australis, Strain 10249 10 AB" /LENGTH=456 /DNA_ID=CAMNT_0008247369 /DNA_START=45 /DNA_END=1415 /DNA_ORIENTATION=-